VGRGWDDRGWTTNDNGDQQQTMMTTAFNGAPTPMLTSNCSLGGWQVHQGLYNGKRGDNNSDSGPHLHDLGWIEYDRMVYYVHPTRHVTTDADLRIDSVLDIVTEYINRLRDGSAPQGIEMWVREGQAQKSSRSRSMAFWADEVLGGP
jgi:hypothetical protein